MKTILQFLKDIEKKKAQLEMKTAVNRNKELTGSQESNFFTRHAILITVETSNEQGLLLEHDQYKKFKKGTDMYYKHPEMPHIPVKAHYHVVDGKSKREIYAVNVDGTAHHRDNKGYKVPEKQADELRKLGVTIAPSNILESKELKLNENAGSSIFSFYLIFEE